MPAVHDATPTGVDSMTHVRTSMGRLASGVALGAAALVISACGTGFDAQTTRVYNAPAGADLRGPDVDALGSTVVLTGAASSTLVTGLVGPVDSDDALVGVEVTGAEGTTYTATVEGGELAIPAGELVQTADEAPIVIAGEGLLAGRLVMVRLTFERGAPVGGYVPIVTREGIYADIPTPATTGPTGGPAGPDEGVRVRPGSGAEEPTDTDS